MRLTGELVASGLVKTSDDPTDKRRRLVSLTVKGRSEAERIALARTTMAQATLALLEEAGVDLFADLKAVNDALDREPLHRRLAALSADRPT